MSIINIWRLSHRFPCSIGTKNKSQWHEETYYSFVWVIRAKTPDPLDWHLLNPRHFSEFCLLTSTGDLKIFQNNMDYSPILKKWNTKRNISYFSKLNFWWVCITINHSVISLWIINQNIDIKNRINQNITKKQIIS